MKQPTWDWNSVPGEPRALPSSATWSSAVLRWCSERWPEESQVGGLPWGLGGKGCSLAMRLTPEEDAEWGSSERFL